MKESLEQEHYTLGQGGAWKTIANIHMEHRCKVMRWVSGNLYPAHTHTTKSNLLLLQSGLFSFCSECCRKLQPAATEENSKLDLLLSCWNAPPYPTRLTATQVNSKNRNFSKIGLETSFKLEKRK